MSAPINVLVTGYGHVGSVLLKTLTSPAFRSRIHTSLLVRPASLQDPVKKSTIDDFKALGVRVVEGDLELSGEEELAKLLRAHSIHTIVAVVGSTQLTHQLPLVRAAKAAGVQRFIPSEFGVDAAAMPSGGTLGQLLGAKLSVQAALKEAAVPYTLICCPAFADLILYTTYFGVDIPNRTVTAPGSFDTKICTAPISDICHVTALAILDPSTRNQTLYVGEPISFEQLTVAVEKATGDKFARKVRTVEEAQKAIDANPADLPARFVSVFAAEKGTLWPATQTYLKQHPSDFSHTPFPQFAEMHLKGKGK